ncbi:E3 ubiquitin-protein ligase RING1-like [Eutrema salsugineum]|uniref:E3 ubiquitin-protein ligase RING1-like n=1 Tax=Eutrema salsugineum TaxID=72664 RepID=UPI000CED6712|nr:E3 ubiquitin-protein ligase RING1-like [Eutrema salsugineum]
MEESGAVTVNIDANTRNNQTSVHPSSHLNKVLINLFHKYQIFATDESYRTVNFTGCYCLPVSQIRLNLHSYEFSPNHLFNLIDSRLHDPPLSGHIAETIANQAVQKVWFPEPHTMVNIVLTEQVFETVSVSRLPEEETQKKEESTCAICLDDDHNNNETTDTLLPCPHRFHMSCIAEWLVRRKSCPLCREIVVEES